MSRSYRNNVYDSYVCYSRKSMKAWRTQENRRLRHNAKQLINNCEDYDKLIIPILDDYETLWGSPQDGKKHIIDPPALNECELYRHDLEMRWGKGDEYLDRWYPLKNGHLKDCKCYSNKHSYYWKCKRK